MLHTFIYIVLFPFLSQPVPNSVFNDSRGEETNEFFVCLFIFVYFVLHSRFELIFFSMQYILSATMQTAQIVINQSKSPKIPTTNQRFVLDIREVLEGNLYFLACLRVFHVHLLSRRLRVHKLTVHHLFYKNSRKMRTKRD